MTPYSQINENVALATAISQAHNVTNIGLVYVITSDTAGWSVSDVYSLLMHRLVRQYFDWYMGQTPLPVNYARKKNVMYIG